MKDPEFRTEYERQRRVPDGAVPRRGPQGSARAQARSAISRTQVLARSTWLRAIYVAAPGRSGTAGGGGAGGLLRSASIDETVNRLDALRVEHDLSKAELARAIDKHPSSVRRLLTAKGNPELATVVAIADALDADLLVVPRERSRSRATATTTTARASRA
jgi:DNA-binding XRE family transcriptional regulator